MRITAAVVHEQEQPFSVEEFELEEPRAGEVLVRLVGTGVCHTDVIARDQWYPVPLPVVLGHEGSGVVERVGEGVTKVEEGDHVVLTFNSCGQCPSCKRGKPAYCLNFFELNFGGTRLDGTTGISKGGEAVHSHFFGQSSFASYGLASERSVVKVPEGAPLELLGPLGCGVQTGAGAVLNVLHPDAGTAIAVFGTGAVGTSAIMAARVAGCTTIIGIDVEESPLELARELGATHTINSSETDAGEEIANITGGGVDYAIETTAAPEVARHAVDALAPLGVCGLVGAAPLGTEFSLDMNDVLIPGKTVCGIVEGDSIPDLFIPRLIELYNQGRFPFDRLIEFYDLQDINRATEDSEQGRVLKPVLRMP